ncbi:MAG: hypothetical protein AAF596_08680, partial [Planctomycetota bacterium]
TMTEAVTTAGAWHGDTQLRERVIASLEDDWRLDRIAQGNYRRGEKGCHLGCLLRPFGDSDDHKGSWHQDAQELLGIPQRVAHWLEAVFEGLPEDESRAWVVESAEAIAVGADLSLSHHHLAAWLLSNESPSAAGNGHAAVVDVIREVRRLHLFAAAGGSVTAEQWSAPIAALSPRAAMRATEWAATRATEWSDIAKQSLEIFRSSPAVTLTKGNDDD